MLTKANERIVSCDWCFHENARSRSAALNLSQSVDLFNQSELLPEVRAEPIRGLVTLGQDSKWRHPMGAYWIIIFYLKPLLILDGYVLNDIWTIVQNRVCNPWRLPIIIITVFTINVKISRWICFIINAYGDWLLTIWTPWDFMLSYLTSCLDITSCSIIQLSGITRGRVPHGKLMHKYFSS